ncbi:MAG: cardiolipin synthase [Defluviitaleaceae bacterium]|nr:cardiolipin synthase [Defluviitaleaceae bacterium]
MTKIVTRMRVTILLLLAQMIAIGFFAAWVVQNFRVVYWAGIFVSILAFSYILKKDEASVYKITWLIVILIYPSVGGVLYLFFGNRRPIKRIAAHMREHALIAKLLDADGNLSFLNRIECGRMYSLMHYIRRASSYHAYTGTETKYYPMGELMFEDMLAEISEAKKFIFLEFFIIKKGRMWDTLLAMLEKKVSEGVEVRLIVDHLGSHKLFSRAYIRTLRAKGIKVLRFNPMVPFLLLFMNNRDHRKILVVDGNAAFTGGINISDEYINLKQPYGIWKDTGIRLRGEAVWSFSLMFIEMWDTFCRQDERITEYEIYRSRPSCAENQYPTDGFVLPYGDTPIDREQLGENVYVDILTQAENYVYIFTPYLIISEKLISALQLAAKRGVDIRLITPGIADKKLVFRLTRSYYRYLLEAGVKIYEYSPGFLHAKGMVCDDKIAVVGTINLDYRSLYLHFECAVLLHNVSVIKDIRDDALRAAQQGKEVLPGPEKWRLWSDLLDAVLHLFAPLM